MAGFFARLCGMKVRTIVEMLMTVISLDCRDGEDPQAISIVCVCIDSRMLQLRRCKLSIIIIVFFELPKE